MRIACTGFVSQRSGSIASANALLLLGLLEDGVEIDFFSKPSFVDPRPVVGSHPGFRFVSVVNRWSDVFRRKMESVPGVNFFTGRLDALFYNRLLVKKINEDNARKRYDLIFWMGDYAQGTVVGVPTVSFVQGPPGSDARSILLQFREITEHIGIFRAWKWRLLANLRLSRFGLPTFKFTNHFIVGSTQSQLTLSRRFGIDIERISILPYPVDFGLFNRSQPERQTKDESDALRMLWLGRIVPRKRLDLFFKGTIAAIEQGLDVKVTIVGQVGFITGYEKWIQEFPYPERINWIRSIPRTEIPKLLQSHDVLAQPSDEEDFGSSVAEAQACGLPVIVGKTNGNSSFLCTRDIHLSDDQDHTMGAAIIEMAMRKQTGRLGEPDESVALAQHWFSIAQISVKLEGILNKAANEAR